MKLTFVRGTARNECNEDTKAALASDSIHSQGAILTWMALYWTLEKGGGVRSSQYSVLKRLCRERKVLYEDPDFPANARALYREKRPHLHPIIWKRPTEQELSASPEFMNGSGRLELELGDLGDPWLMGAVATLTLTPRLLERVIPPDQAFDHTYCGLFRFRIWHFGDWVEVVVDDRLPTYKGRLVHLHSPDPNEFWPSLLEKAYAKFYGSYEGLLGGSTTQALQDLTGGIVQSFPLAARDKFLAYQVLNSAVPRSTLLVVSISVEKERRPLRLRHGLLTQQAYSVTGLARVRTGHLGEVPLVRLRSPGGKGEWTGPWSPNSWEWDSLSDRDKELLAGRVRNDGEFWMSFEDFSRTFTHLDLVHIGPDDWMTEPALHSKRPWRAVLARRRWRAGYNAGGGPTFIDTTATNPQFRVQIPRSGLSKCHVVVSVTQHYVPGPNDSHAHQRKLNAIGFAVYEVPSSLPRLTAHFCAEQRPLDVTAHSVARETPDARLLLHKLLTKYPAEVDASQLLKILKAHWKTFLPEKPSLELCKSLIMLRDAAFLKHESPRGYGKASSYQLRPLLWEAGLTVSNKVLECLVLRFSRDRSLTSQAFIMAMVRLHLAHGTY
ncbi:unnamed protein product [Darwinula stevensoni]|uniref:Calpain catalytic domain-containing protein n=1 Tax=Darwinula stevensoni TaxID=69355 RepID=A0A7R8XDW2_9CRUS|nr:unnamed protein product [Darwinula stevensoni]CAG0893662.1 unnamed protein product [Darwinula stevensoni]